MNSWLITWRNLTHRKPRTFFTFLAVAIGVAAAFAVTGTVETTRDTVSGFLASFNSKADMRIRGTSLTVPEAVVEQVRKSPLVVTSLAHLLEPGRVELASLPIRPSVAEPNSKVVIHGYNELHSGILDWKPVEGSLLEEGLVVSNKTAELWGVKAGDTVVLQVGKAGHSVRVAAVVASNDVLNSPSSWKKALTSRWHVAVPLSLLQEWTGSKGQVRDISLTVAEGRSQEAVSELETIIKKHPGVYLDPILMSENDVLFGLNDIYSSLYMMGALGLLMSAAILFSTMYVSVVERRREFAVMKTLGCSAGQIASILLREVLLLALLGTLTGLVLGAALGGAMTYGFMEMMSDIEESVKPGLAISPRAVLFALASGIGCSLLAAAIPLYEASKTSVAYALRHSVKEKSSRLGNLISAVGLALVAVGLVLEGPARVAPLFAGLLLVYPLLMRGLKLVLAPILRLLLGFEGTLAATGVGRQLHRTSLTSGILCISLSFLLMVGFIRSSMEEGVEQTARFMVGGDLIINTSNPISEDDIHKVRETQGVAGIALVKETNVLWNQGSEGDGGAGTRKILLSGASRPSGESIPAFISYDETPDVIIDMLEEPGTVALAHAVFEVWGGAIGDSITFRTPTGDRTLRVIAAVHTIRENGDAAFVSENRMEGEFGVQTGTRLTLLLDSGTLPAALKERMEGLFGERLSGLRSVDDYLENRREDLLIPFAMMNVLLGLLVVISSVGILNTMMMNVLERRKEIGTMRAIASTSWQIRKIVLGEGLVIGIGSAVTGIALGLALSYSMAEGNVIAGIPMSFRIAWDQVRLAAGFGVTVALGSTLLPAILASRIPITEALRYE